MAKSKNVRKNPKPAPKSPHDHPGKSHGFGRDKARKDHVGRP